MSLLLLGTRGMRRTASIFDNFTPNLPSGMTLWRSTSFGNLIEDEYNADGVAINQDTGFWSNATDATAPFGPSVTDITFPAGSTGGNTTILYSQAPPSSARFLRVYWSCALMLSSNYRAHFNEEKFWYPDVFTEGFSTTQAITGWQPLADETPDGPTVGFKVNTQVGGGNTVFFQSTGNPHRLRKGSWMRVECFAQMNTPLNADGILRFWVDGNVAMDVSTVRWSNHNGQGRFGGVRFTSTRGGGTDNGPVPSGGQFRRLDRLDYYGSTEYA